MTEWKPRITVDPDILCGKPIVRGTRISVDLLMDRLADGWTVEETLAAYPSITKDDVLAAMSAGAEDFREEDRMRIPV